MFRCRSAAGITADYFGTGITQASDVFMIPADGAVIVIHNVSPLNEYDHNTGQSYHTYDEPR